MTTATSADPAAPGATPSQDTPTPVSTLTGQADRSPTVSDPTAATTAALGDPTGVDPATQPEKNAAIDATQTPWGEGIDPDLLKFVGEKTPIEIAKELQAAQALIGKKTIGIPGKDSTPEQQRAFHAARGVPDAADGYDLEDVITELVEKYPGLERDTAREAQFRELARASNISNGEARELMRRTLEAEATAGAERLAELNTANTAAKALVTEHWGPKVDEKTALANAFARHLGLDDEAFDAFMKVAGAKPEARFKLVDAFANMGANLQEGGGPGGDGVGGLASMTPEQAEAAKKAYLDQGDNRAAYQDPSHSRHKRVEAEVTKYLKIQRGVK